MIGGSALEFAKGFFNETISPFFCVRIYYEKDVQVSEILEDHPGTKAPMIPQC